jgi:hypothetical protein
MAATATAQRKKKLSDDDLSVYREFVRLGGWYLTVPLQMNVHFVQRTNPEIKIGDSVETDMTLYYGKKDFYMQVEGMEQIGNDTIIVAVNNEAKMIRLYPNSGQLLKNLEKMVVMPFTDSSLNNLVEQYSASVQDEGNNLRRITLISRSKIAKTDLFKETLSITYQAGTYQPITYDQSRLSLLPVDSTVYSQLTGVSKYEGRLVDAKTDGGNLFFIVKEKITQCRFTKITHDQPTPPAREHDRVLRMANGEYQPAKGYEDYLVQKNND